MIVSYPQLASQVIPHIPQIKFQNPLAWHIGPCPPVHSPFHCLLSLKPMLPSYQAPAPVPMLLVMLFLPLGRAAFLCPFKTPVYVSNSIQALFSRWGFSLISRQSLDSPLYNFPWQLILLWYSLFFFFLIYWFTVESWIMTPIPRHWHPHLQNWWILLPYMVRGTLHMIEL